MKNSYRIFASAIFAGVLLNLSIMNARAAAPFSEFAIGPNAGTTGVGIQLSTPLVPKYLNLTFGYSWFDLGFHAKYSSQNYKGNIRVGGAPIYLSVYPFGPQFHLDAGLYINETCIRLSAAPSSNGTYLFNGHTYHVPTIGAVAGQTHFDPVAPYFGIGWGNPFFGSSHWTFSANAGLFIEGSSKAILTGANVNAVPGAATNIAEAQKTFNGEISFLSIYPVVTFGLIYRF